jgi:hypothetical protein
MILSLDKVFFLSYINELNYINDCIDFMDVKINQDLTDIANKHNGEFNKVKQDFLDDCIAEEFDDSQSISKTFIEAIFVRQIAIVERFLVKLSFQVYHKKIQDEKRIKSLPLILPPNCNIQKNFTDPIKAVEYINKNSNINIKQIKSWERFKVLRDLRHILAHGINVFILEKSPHEKKYNNFFQKEKPILVDFPDIEYYFQMTDNFEPIKEMNTFFIEFIEDIEKNSHGQTKNLKISS